MEGEAQGFTVQGSALGADGRCRWSSGSGGRWRGGGGGGSVRGGCAVESEEGECDEVERQAVR